MDVTPVCFDMPSGTTIDRRGKREIIVCGTGAHKRRLTVTLARTADGEMLKPFITFKAKTARLLKTLSVSNTDAVVTTQPKGWMDSHLITQWIRRILLTHTQGRHALLVFDTFLGHLTDDVLQKLAENNVTYITIPGGCTSKVQPLDVSINKPFKDYLRGSWEQYMVEQVQTSPSPATKIPTASKNEIAKWVIDANRCLGSQPDMIRKSFLVCGISNSLDGSKNDYIRVQEYLPQFVIPYGESAGSKSDPFQSTDAESDAEDSD
jgi:hypothetical protein